MKQESRSIYDFNPGDIITRVEPSALTNSSFMPVNYDCSYIGEKLIFLGVANGCIYLEPTDSFTYLLEKGHPIGAKLHQFEYGWAHYIDPATIASAKPKSKYESMSDTNLVGKLDEAIEVEDYEEASRIKHELDKREI